MAEAGFKYQSLEGLRIHLGAVLIGTEIKGITEATSSVDYIWWNKSLQSSLALLPPEARMPFILGAHDEHVQTQLSS
jgi:hypothetical protein